MNIKHIVSNNSELANITEEQRAVGVEVWYNLLSHTSFVKFAENCGTYEKEQTNSIN